MIKAVNDLPYLDELHSGSVMLTYLVEQDAFGGDRELEERWFAMLEEAIDKGWDIIHFIWLNEDDNRKSHLRRNTHSLARRRGGYKVYVTSETAPLSQGVDFVAVDSRYDSLKRAFVYHALEPKIGEGPHNIAEIRAIYPLDNKHIRQINNILNRLKRWKEGKEGGFKLLSEEERDKLVE